MERKLYRDEAHKVIGGVCAGLAEYFNVDISIVRLVFLLTLILKGGGVLVYIILWAVLPKKDYHVNPFEPLKSPIVDYTVPPGMPSPPDPQIFQPKQRSTGSIIAGAVLVLVGGFFILDDFNLIPDWDFAHFWPVILIAIGIVVIFTGSKKQPWEKKEWHKHDPATDTSTTTDTPANDNTPTI